MSRRGFTLVELAIALAIVGILVGGGFKAMSVISKRTKVTETKEQLESLKEAIIGFAQSNGYLPNGAEVQNLAGKTTDSWSQPIVYIADNALQNDDICYHGQTSVSITGDRNSSDTAFILISSGQNYNLQTALSDGAVNIYNQGSANIDEATTPINRQEDYDDLSIWMSLSELRVAIGCSSKQLSVINQNMPMAYENHNYNSSISIQGGISFADGYDWCVEGSLPNGVSLTCTSALNISAVTCTNSGAKNASATWGRCNSLILSGGVTGSLTTQFNFRVYAYDSELSSTNAEFSITLQPEYPTIANRYLPTAKVGLAYSARLAGRGGDGSYTFSHLLGSLPTGVTFSSPNLSGTPTLAGSYPLIFRVRDGVGRVSQETLVLTVNN